MDHLGAEAADLGQRLGEAEAGRRAEAEDKAKLGRQCAALTTKVEKEAQGRASAEAEVSGVAA